MKKFPIIFVFISFFALIFKISANAIVTTELFDKNNKSFLDKTGYSLFLRWDNMTGEEIKLVYSQSYLNRNNIEVKDRSNIYNTKTIYPNSRCIPLSYNNTNTFPVVGKNCQEIKIEFTPEHKNLYNTKDLIYKIGNNHNIFRLQIFNDELLFNEEEIPSLMGKLNLSRIEFLPFDDNFSYLMYPILKNHALHIQENLVQMPMFINNVDEKVYSYISINNKDYKSKAEIFLDTSYSQLVMLNNTYIIAIYSSFQNIKNNLNERQSIVTIKIMTINQYKTQRQELLNRLMTKTRMLKQEEAEHEIAFIMPQLPNHEIVPIINELPEGDYKSSCIDVLYTGNSTNILSASCLNNNKTYHFSSIKVTDCPYRIANINGKLACKK